MKSHIQEVKNNTNTLYSKLQLSPFSWSYLANVDALTTIESEHYQEMRNAADYAHDMNYCRGHDSTDYGSVDSLDRVSVDSGYDTAVCGGNNSGAYSGDYVNANYSNNIGG
ncbi:MAG: hypothetical protein AB1563_07535 [Bacillota bacterium]